MSRPSPNRTNAGYPHQTNLKPGGVSRAEPLAGPGRPRRQWAPARKLQLVLETLQSDRQLAEICRREGLSPTLIYGWSKHLLGSAEAIFAKKPRGAVDRRTDKLAVDNARMKSVIAEIRAENLELKEMLWD